MKLILMAVLVVTLSGCSIVGPGERGVRISMGQTSSDAKEPGAYLWIPFLLGMTKINVQIQKSEIEASAGTSDMQEIKTHVAINWSLAPTAVVKTYREIGDESDVLDRIIAPAVNEAFKSSIAKNTAEEVLSKRMELKAKIDSSLQERLARYGVTLNDVSIVNLTFSKEFTDAIEAKQIAEQQALQAKYSTQKAIEDAKAVVNTAKGQAEAQRIVKESITPMILQKMAVEKWNGVLPVYNGSGAIPLLNLK